MPNSKNQWCSYIRWKTYSFNTYSPLLKITSWPLLKYEEQELTKTRQVWEGYRCMHHNTYVWNFSAPRISRNNLSYNSTNRYDDSVVVLLKLRWCKNAGCTLQTMYSNVTGVKYKVRTFNLSHCHTVLCFSTEEVDWWLKSKLNLCVPSKNPSIKSTRLTETKLLNARTSTLFSKHLDPFQT